MAQFDVVDEPIHNRGFNNGQHNNLNGHHLGRHVSEGHWTSLSEGFYGGLGNGQSGNMHLNNGLANMQNHNRTYHVNNGSGQNSRLAQDQAVAHQQMQVQMQMFAARAHPNMFVPRMHNSMVAVSTNGLHQPSAGSQPSSNSFSRSTPLQYSQGASTFNNNSWNGNNAGMNFLPEQTGDPFMNLEYTANSTDFMSSNLAMPHPISQVSYPLVSSMGLDMPPPGFNPSQVHTSSAMNQLHSQSDSPQPSNKIPVSSLLSATPAPFNPYAQ